jgi:hypothetical protein
MSSAETSNSISNGGFVIWVLVLIENERTGMTFQKPKLEEGFSS